MSKCELNGQGHSVARASTSAPSSTTSTLLSLSSSSIPPASSSLLLPSSSSTSSSASVIRGAKCAAPSSSSPTLQVTESGSNSTICAATNTNTSGSSAYYHHRSGRILCDGYLRLVEILRVNIVQLRNLPIRNNHGNGSSSNHISNNDHVRPVTVLARLDTFNIFQSTSTANGNICCFGDDFVHEISNTFSQLHFLITENVGNRLPRQIGLVSIRKRDIVKHSGEDRWYRIQAISRQNDVSGQICIDVRCEPTRKCLAIKVVDYTGLNVREPADLYLLVTLQVATRVVQSKKLNIGINRESAETLFMECDGTILDNNQRTQRVQLRMSLWHDVLPGFNSYFQGQIRITLDDDIVEKESIGPQWYYLKPRMTGDENDDGINGGTSDVSATENQNSLNGYQQLGELRLRLFYTAEHVLPLEFYKPLQMNLVKSLTLQPFCASPAGILEYLPSVDILAIARPLMKIFVQAELIRPLLRVLCSDDILKCQDINTLFRSQSLATKIIHEQMKFFGHHYLVTSIKPVIDMIYCERKCCEIDPMKLKQNDSLESNKLNLIVYGEIAFSRVVDSSHRCPLVLREMFSDLRELAAKHFHGREDVQRLVLSSFIIMRFFAAALMNPKSFGLKRDQPEGVVCRTLVLLSKILQRLSNCVVSANSLTEKEPWLSSVLERFTDEQHRLAMLKFLNTISMTENATDVNGENLSVVRDGFFIERKIREKRRILRNLVNQKRRYVVLTENEICWQKTKADAEPKGRMRLQEVNQIEPVVDAKNVFRIASPDCEIQFQAPSTVEMNEWIVQIQKQRKRQLMIALRTSESNDAFEIDTERELEAIHAILYENAETIKQWKNVLEGTEIPNGHSCIPSALQDQLKNSENPEQAKQLFYSSLQEILHSTLLIEKSHDEILNRFIKQIRYGKGTRELPIGDDNYLLLKSRFHKSIDEI
ncbi:CBR-GAP-1 protein [Loa loa]|uniref:CBR-GAP-1 protein n=1 Tax=Loa loa TaxID=7209 RepID=A0A1I7VEV7_LOALO|nr:CBR-GAP-1 protein [Loa loa]EJD75727.1 CBR-GAP-1 protein [Loa loa]